MRGQQRVERRIGWEQYGVVLIDVTDARDGQLLKLIFHPQAQRDAKGFPFLNQILRPDGEMVFCFVPRIRKIRNVGVEMETCDSTARLLLNS